MRDLENNQTSIFQKFETLVEFSTKFMHYAATTLYFLHLNKEEKDLGKESETTRSIYGFLVEDLLKTIFDKPIKVEGEGVDKDMPQEKKEDDHGQKEGS